MTSMIDVVLFLLMFFVVTSGTSKPALLLPAPLAADGEIESHLSATATAIAESNTIEIWLKLRHDPALNTTSVEISGNEYSPAEARQLLTTLAELDPENPVIFDVGPNVILGEVVNLYDTCQAVGFEKIQFAAKSP